MINLSGINTNLSITSPNYRSGASPTQQKQISASENPTDKVTISSAAKTASDLGLEKYAAPKWINDYIAPLNIVNSDLALKPGGQWDEQREAFKTELKQYGEYWGVAYQSAMKAVGATDGKSYNDIVTNDPSAADRAGGIFRETLLGMPGIRSLMSRLSVPAANQS